MKYVTRTVYLYLKYNTNNLFQAATAKLSDANKVKRKFSSFFKSLVIELDKDLYGPDNHLVEVRFTLFVNRLISVRASVVVRAFASSCDGSSDRSFMGWTQWAIFRSSQCSTNWCNKGHGMCYPVCGMMHIKEPLLLIGKSSPCGGGGFPLSLYEWSFTIYLMPYNRK